MDKEWHGTALFVLMVLLTLWVFSVTNGPPIPNENRNNQPTTTQCGMGDFGGGC